MSPATVSMVLTGKRRLSRDAAIKVSRTLMLDPQETSELLSHFPDRRASAIPDPDQGPAYAQLTIDQFRAISEWHHYAILSLLKTEGFRNDAKWIGARLGLPAPEIVRALETMKRLGILEEAEDGRLNRTRQKIRTSDDIADLSLRKAHFRNVELAHRSLEKDPVEVNDFTSLTLALHPGRLKEAKAMIRRFQDEFDALMETADPVPTEVYRLLVQLFPLSQGQAQSRVPKGKKHEKR